MTPIERMSNTPVGHEVTVGEATFRVVATKEGCKRCAFFVKGVTGADICPWSAACLSSCRTDGESVAFIWEGGEG